ncbi:hypothetical protein GRI39_01460 [Altererythrobacter indicus]|uniref:Uncharacterized protein n=1 Tax=Altericroceibacterium indicum TaxID=374177 RepID=A0A845A619_9SPHN|nr:hypothetical protein [Altericroceibacterium indicum]MXP24713.1 hypothetical protein [Altericroceibacterium indicum]
MKRSKFSGAGQDDRTLYAELQRPLAEREISMIQMMAEEGQSTFDIWTQGGRSGCANYTQ